MKLYVIVHAALSLGLKCAQACHALRQFIEVAPGIDRDWFASSNNIVVLQNDDIPSLSERLKQAGFVVAEFYEPDLDDRMTAICVEPGAGRLLSSLPLAR